MRVARLAGVESSGPLARLAAGLDASAPSDYRELAAVLATEWHGTSARTVGIAGGQGVGKSTLAALVRQAGDRLGCTTCVLSLDDFYLGRMERRRLAERVHPLFETRGPPGTHDVARLRAILPALREDREVRLPVFDKGRDDRVGDRRVRAPFDRVVLEGWCVGAAPLEPEALDAPCNALESERDPQGVWRRAVARELEERYGPIWGELDRRVVLEAPDLDCVRRWRLDQESERPAELRMDAAAVDRFVQHFERITRSMAQQPLGAGEIRVVLGRDHRIEGIERGGADAG